MKDSHPAGHAGTGSLFGRAPDLEVVRAFLVSAAARGGALLLSGEPGVGKSVVLDAAAETASAAGPGTWRRRPCSPTSRWPCCSSGPAWRACDAATPSVRSPRSPAPRS